MILHNLNHLEVVKIICKFLDKLAPSKIKGLDKYEQLITFVEDRAGHDRRYSIDNTKIKKELNWTPKETFRTGIKKTVQWYLSNPEWVDEVKNKTFDDWVNKNYKERS